MLGKLLVFEGLNGCGKSTQIQLLKTYLDNSKWFADIKQKSGLREVFCTHEPGGTQLGKNIRKLLLMPNAHELIGNRAELFLFLADRAQHVDKVLRPHLEKDLILCDRYYPSTFAFQGLNDFNHTMLKELNQFASLSLEPDVIFWLDCGIEIAAQRVQGRFNRDSMDDSDVERLERLQTAYQLQSEQNYRFVRIDARGDKTTVLQLVINELIPKIAKWYP
jgi:dTMP kinase